jgi:galactose mutarotase-like enzyme
LNETIEIASGDSRARISLCGAELKNWSVAGAELIWQGDEKFWAESAPILFPIVGWTRDGVVVDDRRYPLGLHGFAREQQFALAEQEASRAVFRLVANPATRALYPFDFTLDVEYMLIENELNIIIHVMNEGKRLLPYACGLHPGFLWPLPGAGGRHVLRFDKNERAEVPVIAPGGLFSPKTRQIPLHGRELALSPQLFEEALCFLDARSAGLEFFARDASGGENSRLRMELENFPHIALWSRPGAAFLCLEAWTGYGDPENFDGDICAKPSMRLLKPGESARSAATFSWRA